MGWPSIILYVVIFYRDYYELVFYSVVLSPQQGVEGITIKKVIGCISVFLSVCFYRSISLTAESMWNGLGSTFHILVLKRKSKNMRIVFFSMGEFSLHDINNLAPKSYKPSLDLWEALL